jgi:hypothetical protein
VIEVSLLSEVMEWPILKYAPSPPDVPKVHPTKDFFTKISLGSGMTEIQKSVIRLP